MLNKFLKRSTSRDRKTRICCPSQFSDPVAMKAEWSPMKDAGNLQTRRLVNVSPNRLEFRVTLEALCFYLFFLFGGMVPFFLVPWDVLSFRTVVLLLGGVAMSTAGGYGFYSGTTPIVFDRSRRFFWKGRKEPDALSGTIHQKEHVRFENIHALQLVTNYSTDGRFDYMYEMNLVLNDGRRIHLVAQRNLINVRENAGTLSQFLERPVWDAI
ncbi:MAG: hypothetical protein C0403_19050 [Desulfobacterium sp.]|nr:hypothetical protein [Desulfobacterium sp.]